MPLLKLLHHHHSLSPAVKHLTPPHHLRSNLFPPPAALQPKNGCFMSSRSRLRNQRHRSCAPSISASSAPLDLTEDNIKQVLADAKTEASFLLFSLLQLQFLLHDNNNVANLDYEFVFQFSLQLAQLFDTSVNITGEFSYTVR
ncbi:hypothetical protein MIMGU_mgv1a014182mg [Erythranthe guttata]|uniref:Uncharacterized protein n=1 Tax=Erythranthe guttata TaxID=4155 RepID=A0A022QC29_ERYGU|nr:hypothetical protein MIMGU_mgv1a014182mg [Erythranthe guttata]